MKKIFILFSFLIFLNAKAQTSTTPNMGAVSTATGGAGTAVVDLDDSALINPATVPLLTRKQMSLSYSTNRLGIVLADNGHEALFPAAIAYEQLSNDSFKNKVYHLILAYPLLTKLYGNFSFGLDFNFNDLKFLNTDTSYKQTRVNAGFIWQPSKSISVGLSHKNIALNDTDLPDSIDHVTTTDIGISYVYESFAKIRFDIESVEKQPANRYAYKIGLETYLNDWVITRFGYRNDNIASMNFATAGLGFAGPQFGLHYAYQVEAKNTIDPLHIIDLSIPF